MLSTGIQLMASLLASTVPWVPTEGGQLVSVGMEGVILRAQAGAFPNPVRFLEFPQKPAENLFLFSGSLDQTFRLDFSTDLVDWTFGSELEITDPQGVLLLLDGGTNNPAQQFFRATPR